MGWVGICREGGNWLSCCSAAVVVAVAVVADSSAWFHFHSCVAGVAAVHLVSHHVSAVAATWLLLLLMIPTKFSHLYQRHFLLSAHHFSVRVLLLLSVSSHAKHTHKYVPYI